EDAPRHEAEVVAGAQQRLVSGRPLDMVYNEKHPGALRRLKLQPDLGQCGLKSAKCREAVQLRAALRRVVGRRIIRGDHHTFSVDLDVKESIKAGPIDHISVEKRRQISAKTANGRTGKVGRTAVRRDNCSARNGYGLPWSSLRR